MKYQTREEKMKEENKLIKCDFCDKNGVDVYQDLNGGEIVYTCNDHHREAIEKLYKLTKTYTKWSRRN